MRGEDKANLGNHILFSLSADIQSFPFTHLSLWAGIHSPWPCAFFFFEQFHSAQDTVSRQENTTLALALFSVIKSGQPLPHSATTRMCQYVGLNCSWISGEYWSQPQWDLTKQHLFKSRGQNITKGSTFRSATSLGKLLADKRFLRAVHKLTTRDSYPPYPLLASCFPTSTGPGKGTSHFPAVCWHYLKLCVLYHTNSDSWFVRPWFKFWHSRFLILELIMTAVGRFVLCQPHLKKWKLGPSSQIPFYFVVRLSYDLSC